MTKLRWGLLGCGDIATKRVADAIRSDAGSELVAACRRDKERLEAFADQFEIEHRMTSAEELVSHDLVDAVYIATPVYEHRHQTIAAAGAGKHVLVEKPMALNPVECQEMLDACQDANVNLAVAYYRRFYPIVLRIAELISNGTIGRPLSILATTGNNTRFPKDDWRVVKELGGGGPLMDIGSHRLDLFHQLFGDASKVRSTCAPSPSFDAEDVASLMIEFSNGRHGILQCFFGTVDTPDRLEVIGTDGRLATEDLNAGRLSIYTSDGVRHEELPPPANLHAPLVTDFRIAVERGLPPRVTGEIGMVTNQIIDQAYRDADA